MSIIQINDVMDKLPMIDNTICNLCRLCSKNQGKMISIYTNTDEDQSLESKIQAFLPFIDLNQNELFPKHVCCSCMSTLMAFNDLWNTSKEVNEKFNVMALEIENNLKVNQENNSNYNNTYEKDNNLKNNNTALMEPVIKPSTTIMCKIKINNDSKSQLKKISNNEKEIIQETEINYGSEVSEKKHPEKTSVKNSTQNVNCSEVHKTNECLSYSVDSRSSILMDALLRPPIIYLDEDDKLQNYGEVFRHSGADHSYSLPESQLDHKWLWRRSKPEVKEFNIDHTYAMWQWEKIAMNLSITESSACKLSEELISFSCSECPASYYDQILLKRHIKTMHPKQKKQKLEVTKVPRPKPVICDRCQRKFPRQGLLDKHRCRPSDVKAFYEQQRVEIDGDGFYKCDQCSFFTRVRRNGLTCFRRHYELHTTGFNVKCDQCPNKAFRTTRALKEHVDTVHKGIKRFVCTECGKRFAARNSLKTHLLMHSGEKPYLCDECGKTFRHISKLRSHKRFTHLKEKNYLCSECDQRYATIQLLNMHMTRHTGVRDFICEDCGKAFFTKKTMMEHTKAIHRHTLKYTCTVCNKSFKVKRNFLLHNKKKHGIELQNSDIVPINKLQLP